MVIQPSGFPQARIFDLCAHKFSVSGHRQFVHDPWAPFGYNPSRTAGSGIRHIMALALRVTAALSSKLFLVNLRSPGAAETQQAAGPAG